MDKKDYEKNKWIEIENQGIKDIIVNNVDKMLSINDDLFLNNFMDIDVLTSDDITFFDKYDNITTYDTEGVAKNGEHWEKMTDEYINILNNRLKQDLNNLSKDEFKKVLSDYYKEFRKHYIIGLKISAIDLADKNVRLEYAKRQTEIIANMQTQEINNIGLKKFCNINLDETPYKFTYYTSIENLKLIQKHNINILKLIEEELKNPNKKTPSKVSIDTPKTNNKKRKPPHRQVLSYMETLILKDQQKVVDKMYEDSKDFYDKRHKKYLEIDKLIKKVIKKYKKYNTILEAKQSKSNSIIKVNNEVSKGYTFIDNRLQKELEKLQNNKEKPLDLKLDFQSSYKGKGHKKKPIHTPVVVKININGNIEIYGDKMSAWDKFILNRAFSLWQVNKTHLSPELIYKDFINKNVDATHMGADIYDSILTSIQKFRTSTISFIFEDPNTIKRLGLSDKEIKYIGVDRYILPLESNFVKHKNGKVNYTFTYMKDYEPQYFVLAEKIGQIKSADRKLIPIDTGFSMTTERILIIDYLASHIEYLKSTKNNPKYSDEISYERIFDKCDLLVGIDKKTAKYRQYKKKYITDIKNYLTYHKTNNNIKDFTEYPIDKKRKQGIKIKV